MPGQLRMTDVGISVCSHGLSCCPHLVTSIVVTGSPDNQTNNRSSTRAHIDVMSHDCPHCGISAPVQGSPDTKINNLPAHRNTDSICNFCGCGVSVTSSPDDFVNEG